MCEAGRGAGVGAGLGGGGYLTTYEGHSRSLLSSPSCQLSQLLLEIDLFTSEPALKEHMCALPVCWRALVVVKS